VHKSCSKQEGVIDCGKHDSIPPQREIPSIRPQRDGSISINRINFAKRANAMRHDVDRECASLLLLNSFELNGIVHRR
jgi:hypothetical protein